MSRFLVHAPARFLEGEFEVSYSTILLRDKEVLRSDIPEPQKTKVQGILVDEKFFGPGKGYAAILRLILWIRMCMKSKVRQLKRFVRGVSEKFKRNINGIRYSHHSARIESAHAAIKRIQFKACGLVGMEYLFLKMRQVHFMRLQRLHKTSHDYYQQI